MVIIVITPREVKFAGPQSVAIPHGLDRQSPFLQPIQVIRSWQKGLVTLMSPPTRLSLPTSLGVARQSTNDPN